MERLPIKFFAKREEDNMRVEGGGNKTLPSFVLSGDELVKRNELLCYLGMEKKKTAITAILGVVLAGIIMLIFSYGILGLVL